MIKGRSEVERRMAYFKPLESHIGSYSDLADLVKQCLHNAPETRPTAEQLLTKLQKIKEEQQKQEHGLSQPIRLDMEKLRMSKEIKEKSIEIKEKDKRLRDLQVLKVCILTMIC